MLTPTSPAELRAALKATERADYLAIVPSNGDEPLFVTATKVREALAATRHMGVRVFVRLEPGRTGLEFRWGQVGRLLLVGRPRAAVGRYEKVNPWRKVWRARPPQRPAFLHVASTEQVAS